MGEAMIPSYILLALLSMFVMGIVDFVFGMAARKKISYGTMMCSAAFFFLPVSTLWALAEGPYTWTAVNFLGAATAALAVFAFWSLMRSVSFGELSVSAPIYRMNFVFSAFAAILFLEESMTIQKGAGFLGAALSIFLISELKISRGRLREIKGKSIFWAVMALFAMGGVNILFKIAVSRGLGPGMFLHSQAVFFTALVFLYAYLHQGGPRFSRPGWAFGLAVGIGNFTWTLALLFALRAGEVSIVTPISQLSFVISVLLATLGMGERITVRKVSGLLLAVATIAAFSK
jgi:uncharacterized membrane protein